MSGGYTSGRVKKNGPIAAGNPTITITAAKIVREDYRDSMDGRRMTEDSCVRTK